MPSMNARGARIATAVAMRTGVVAPVGRFEDARCDEAVDEHDGEQDEQRCEERSAGWSLRRMRSVHMLPMPLKTSIENSTTVRP